MISLGTFFQPTSPYTRVIGTYLYPPRLLSEPDWYNPLSATEVIARCRFDSLEILITRNGGLFVEPPHDLSDSHLELEISSDTLAKKFEFEYQVSHLFNRLICEFALRGIITEPASPVHISQGKLIDNHALIVGAGGGREFYPERTINQARGLLDHTWSFARPVDSALLGEVIGCEYSQKLEQLSSNLPTLLAGAYSQYSRHQLTEALVDSWIVVEQVIDWLWTDYISQYKGQRKDRLKDARTYSTAVRLEVLAVVGILDSSLYEHLNLARTHRNKLVHRAEIDYKVATEAVIAMQKVIEFFLACSVAPPIASRGVNW